MVEIDFTSEFSPDVELGCCRIKNPAKKIQVKSKPGMSTQTQ
jgi:hypothetical protein